MIILVGGRAGEGKTTFSRFCAQYLSKDYDQSTIIAPFARGVKKVAEFVGWNGEKDEKGRKLLQGIGNIGREYNPDIWVKLCADIIENFFAQFPTSYAFCDDWRFPNEYKYMQERFHPVIKVRIRRPEKYHTLLDTPYYDDISEVSLPEEDDYYHFVIDNSGNLNDFEERAVKFIERVKDIYEKRER